MDSSDRDSSELVKACRELHAMPQTLTDEHAHSFFTEFPLERIFRAIATTRDQSDVALVADVIGGLLGTELGSGALPTALPYLEAAADSPLPPLRRFAADQYGSLLSAQVRKNAPMQRYDGPADDGVGDAACMQLVRLLSDPDTIVAEAAARALRTYCGSGLAALQRLLSPGSAPATALAAAASSVAQAGVVRLRVLALVLELAAGGDGARRLRENDFRDGGAVPAASASASSNGAAGPSTTYQAHSERLQLLRSSGLLQPLLDQLSDPSDALACLAALQMLEELLARVEPEDDGGGVAEALAAIALPQLLALVSDPTLADAALPLVAGILHRIMPAAPPTAALAAALARSANGAASADGVDVNNDETDAAAAAAAAAAAVQPALAAAPALLAAVRAVLDDRGNASAAAEACGLDALGTLGQSAAGAQMVVSDEAITGAVCERALGRSPHPEIRIAALHAVASLAGLERAGRDRDRTAGLLPVQYEEALRRAVYCACGLRRPAQVLAGLLQQPFLELRLASYRCIAALALRSWFAVDLVTTPDLYDRITDASSDSGAAACTWRHAAAAALWATVSAAAEATGDAPPPDAGEVAFAATLAAQATVERVRAAVRGGPYGTDAGSRTAAAAAEASRMHEEHFVASRGAGGGM